MVEYQGRGHEDFYDEILRIFDWMGRFRRNFYPREFTCATMRPWDNYFWWVEMDGMPPKVDGRSRPIGRRRPARVPMKVEGTITKTNSILITVRGRAGQRLALAADGRFQAAREHHGQRQADERRRTRSSRPT